MQIKKQSIAFNILNNFKGVNDIDPIEQTVELINDNFNKGLIDELTVEQAFEQLDNVIQKSAPHKYFKREGMPGNYKYYYTEDEYNKAKGTKDKKEDKKKGTIEDILQKLEDDPEYVPTPEEEKQLKELEDNIHNTGYKKEDKKEEEEKYLKSLVGKKAVNDTAGEEGVILDASTIKDYKKLLKYDDAGWMGPSMKEDYEIDDNAILVAFKDSKYHETQVYVLGEGGVTLMKEKKGDGNIVDNVNNGEIINSLFKEWNSIKTPEQHKEWAKKVANAKFGTYEDKTILNVMSDFNPKFPNEIIKKDFINEIQEAYKTKDTKTESKLLGNIESRLKSVEKDSQEKIDVIKNYETKLKEHVNKLKNKLPLLEMAAEEYGATISYFNFHKTGNSGVWTEGDGLNVSFSLTPTEKSKIRYIKDKGYDQNGRNKNDSELKAQAEKLQQFLSEKLSVDTVSVNKFSFEVKSSKPSNSILVEFWID